MNLEKMRLKTPEKLDFVSVTSIMDFFESYDL